MLELEQVIPLFSCLLSTYVKMEPKQAADALLAIRLYGSKGYFVLFQIFCFCYQNIPPWFPIPRTFSQIEASFLIENF